MTKCTTEQIIKILFLKFSLFFDFFKIKFKNEVCSNLTTQTSKFHFDFSKLSNQWFRGFLLSLLSKISKHFFRNFCLGSLKKSYLKFKVEFQKMTEFIVCIYISYHRKKMNKFKKFSPEKIVSDGELPNHGGFIHILGKIEQNSKI
jgi:hypothetical protein